MDKVGAKLLTKLADQLGVAIPHLWGVMVKQAFWESVLALVLTPIMLLALGKATMWLYREHGREESASRYSERGTFLGVGLWLAAIAWAISVIGFTCCLPSIITGIANPEYAALQNLLRMVRG